MSNDSRASMIRSAAALIGARGLSGTSFTDVLADSGAPRGSIYHHFPGGKKQLAEAAIAWISTQIIAHLRACPASTPGGVLECFVGLWRQSVLASDCTSGCPVAGVAVDAAAAGGSLLPAARAAFNSWADALAERLEAAGLPPPRAASMAVTALASMEGALILCRAERGPQPLETIAQELMRLLPPEAQSGTTSTPAGSPAERDQ